MLFILIVIKLGESYMSFTYTYIDVYMRVLISIKQCSLKQIFNIEIWGTDSKLCSGVGSVSTPRRCSVLLWSLKIMIGYFNLQL